MPRTIDVVPYDPAWPEKYEQEARLITQLFTDLLVSIHHIGSTAIPGIQAKPVIDILVVVQNIDQVDDFNPAMIQLGYTPRGEYGIPGRRYFKKDAQGFRSHHVHVYPQGHKNIALHLNFRDYLRAHHEKAQAYSKLKEKLAQQFREDSQGYTEAKTDFIEGINRRAAIWREQQTTGDG